MGFQPYKVVLESVKEHLSNPGPIKHLLADLEELQGQIRKVRLGFDYAEEDKLKGHTEND